VLWSGLLKSANEFQWYMVLRLFFQALRADHNDYIASKYQRPAVKHKRLMPAKPWLLPTGLASMAIVSLRKK
jgi:hypothetical protein